MIIQFKLRKVRACGRINQKLTHELRACTAIRALAGDAGAVHSPAKAFNRVRLCQAQLQSPTETELHSLAQSVCAFLNLRPSLAKLRANAVSRVVGIIVYIQLPRKVLIPLFVTVWENRRS